MRLGRPLLLAAVAAAAAFGACTLNPQPLPPSENDRATVGNDAGNFGSSDSASPQNPPPEQGPDDASVGANDGDGMVPAADADGGDGGITDADTDGG